MNSPFDLPTSLPTWPSPSFDIQRWREENIPPRYPSPRDGRLGALVVAVGLVIGGLAWVVWRRSQRHEAANAAPVPTPEPSAAVWLPRSRAEIEGMIRGVGCWIRMAPQTDDRTLARRVWETFWPDVPFPRLGSVDANLQEALHTVLGVIAAARAEHEHAPASEPVSGDGPPDQLDDAERLDGRPLSASPRPGCFYRIRRDDNLLGDAGIAACALRAAVMDAAQRRGRAPESARRRADRLAGEPQAQATYAELIQRGAWNARLGPELDDGELLWLPPLHQGRLLDRSRKRRIVVDPQPWPDGTSKLEPPPIHRGSPTCSLATAV